MKKRIFSFVIMLVTMVALIAFGAPSIKNNTKIGMEYNGGFDILYEVKTDNDELSTKNLVKTAAEGIEKRLDISNVLDPIVSVEGNKYVRVTVSSSNQIVADEIRETIESSAEISFRDFENNLLATGEEILKDVGATLSSETDASGNPVILLNIKDTALLGEITENVSGLSDKHLVVWLGFEEGDDYANISTDASVAKKIVYNATVSSKLETETITVTGSFTKSQAQSTVDLINSGTLDYSLNVVQLSSIEAKTAERSFTKLLISFLVAIVLVGVCMSVYYKLGGLMSTVSILFSTFLTMLLFNAFKGILNQQAIAALIVSLAIFVDAAIILLERVKTEQYNGKNLERALNEGYKKSVYSIVDANIVVFIMATVMFILGTSIANFALVLALASVCSLVIMTLVNKLLLDLLVKLNVKATSFGAKKAYLENKEAYLNRKSNSANPLSKSKKCFIGASAFALISIVVMLVLQLTLGTMFNYNSTVKEQSSVTIVSSTNYFTDDTHIKNFFAQEELGLEVKNINTSSFEDDGVTKYKVTVTTKENVINVENELKNKVIEAYGENYDYDERYELYINSINPKSTGISLLSALYTTGIGLLLVGVYLAIRYRYSYAIAAVISTICSVLLTAMFLGLTRIPVGSDAVISVYAISVFSMNTLIVIFDRLKEMISGKGRKYISNEERKEAVTKSINVSLSRTVLTTLAVILVSIVLLAFSSISSYSFYIALVVGLFASSACAVYIASNTWLLFEKRSDTRKRTFKPKKKSKIFKELEEHTFIGIND